MQIRQWRVVATACVLTALTVSITAAGARFWQVSTQADFLKGDVQNLSVDQYGRLTLGPALTAVGESTTPFLWTLVPAADGGVYAGSGNDGQVFHFAPDGTRTVFFDAAELEVHALAPAPGGGLFVGTSPAGKIYRVDAKGQSTVYFDPEDKYIWSLAVDAAGVLYAATGEKGLIYKITAEGKGDVFYRTKATHAITLLFDKNGDLLAGTESPGKVFRIKKRRHRVRSARSRDRRDQRAPSRCRRHCLCVRSYRPRRGLQPSQPRGSRHVRHDHVRSSFGLHRDHLGHDRGRQSDRHGQFGTAPAKTVVAVRAARSIGSCPTVSPMSCGSRATMCRTTCCRRRTDRSSSQPAPRANCTGSLATRSAWPSSPAPMHNR